MIRSRIWGLFASTTLAAGALVAGPATPPAVAASAPWVGTVSFTQHVNEGLGSFDDTCHISSGNEEVTSSVDMNWDVDFHATGLSIPDTDSSSSTPYYPPTHSTLSYSETVNQSDVNCNPNSESYSGSFDGQFNLGGAHDSQTILLTEENNNFYVRASTGIITGTSNESPEKPPENDSATWRAFTQTVVVPIHGDTAAETATTKVTDDGEPLSEFYGPSPSDAHITSTDTMVVSLKRQGSTPAPKPPTTKIIKSPPKKSTSKTATFRFTSNSKHAIFRCAIDGKKAKVCTSPAIYHHLSLGKHRFVVDATDKVSGLKDKTPAARTWTVKKKPKKPHHKQR